MTHLHGLSGNWRPSWSWPTSGRRRDCRRLSRLSQPASARNSTADCKRVASIALTPRCHRVPRKCSGSCSEPAFRRNTAERVYTIEAARNPEVAGSNPAPATEEGPGNGAFRLLPCKERLVHTAHARSHSKNAARQRVTPEPFRGH